MSQGGTAGAAGAFSSPGAERKRVEARGTMHMWRLLQQNCNANVFFLFVLRRRLCERLTVCSQKR